MPYKPRQQHDINDICECVALNCRGRMFDQHDGKMKCDRCKLVVKIPASDLRSLITKGEQ